MDSILKTKSQYKDFEIEFDIVPVSSEDNRSSEIEQSIQALDESIIQNIDAVDTLDYEIAIRTNQAEIDDYLIAASSGIICGVVDAVFVNEFSLDNAQKWGQEKTEKFVVNIANKRGYKGNDLYEAVKHLEKEYPIAADKAVNPFGGGLQHHLRDFSHHPTIIGLFFSILTQFTGKVYGTDTAGNFLVVSLDENGLALVGRNTQERFVFGVINWFFHMVSDMAGSSSSIRKGKAGTGLPGPLVSLLKEVSALPVFSKKNEKGFKEFSVYLSKLFNGTLLGKRDEEGKLIPLKYDLRTEMGVMNYAKELSYPVMINECIVRGFHFIKSLYREIKTCNVKTFSDLRNINWNSMIPRNSRTLYRLLTISTGIMTVIDIGHAAVLAVMGKDNTGFLGGFLVKVNFVGIGRTTIAIGKDYSMGIKRGKLQREKLVKLNERMFLMNAKLFYKQEDMWILAEDASHSIDEAYIIAKQSAELFRNHLNEIQKGLDKIPSLLPGINQNNPGLIDDLLRELR